MNMSTVAPPTDGSGPRGGPISSRQLPVLFKRQWQAAGIDQTFGRPGDPGVGIRQIRDRLKGEERDADGKYYFRQERWRRHSKRRHGAQTAVP